jgi:hypothetical protein
VSKKSVLVPAIVPCFEKVPIKKNDFSTAKVIKMVT